MFSCYDISKHLLQKSKEENIPMSPMKLLKLVYMAHGYYLAFFESPLIFNEIQAWRYGPVIPDLYNTVRIFGDRNIDSRVVDRKSTKDLDLDTKEFITAFWNRYKHMTGGQLSTLTHQPNTPWDITYNIRGINSPIDNLLIKNHYEEIVSENG